MDLFQIPEDYKPEKPLTDNEMDEITNYLKNHPLFMKQIPQDINGNPHLIALQSLMAQDPNIAAENLNKQASHQLKQKPENIYYMKDAYQKYTQAIELKSSDSQLNAKLHCNRAAINFKIKNYGKVIEDCKLAIKYDPKYVKAFYRYGKALFALNKLAEAQKLIIQNHHPDLIPLLKQIQIKINQGSNEKLKQIQKISEIETYLQNKKWKCTKRQQPLPEGVKIVVKDGVLSVPIVIIYPQFNQFDIIAKSAPDEKIRNHVCQLFKNHLPWDTQNDYNLETIELYAEISQAVLLRVPKQARLQQIYSKVTLKEALQIYVVCKNNAFYRYYLSNHKVV